MKKITAKIGGSSLADSMQWKKVGKIISGNSDIVMLTVSAPGKRNNDDTKITKHLAQIAKKIQKGKRWEKEWAQVEDRFSEIITGLGLNKDLLDLLEEVRVAISGESYEDFILSRGEYLSAKIMTAYLRSLGKDAEFFDAKDYIVFEGGVLDYESTIKKISRIRTTSSPVIMPGFYGADHQGRIFAFPKGGSDLTGALLACGSKSLVYENWTDANGICMADPKRVDNPPTLPELVFIEAHILNLTGASVLHKDTIPYLKDAGIILHVKNTNNPKGKGTRIYPELPNRQIIPKGLALLKETTVFRIAKLVAHEAVGFGEKFMHIFASRNIPYAIEIPGIDTSALVVENKYLTTKIMRAIEGAIKKEINPDKIEIFSGMAVIATIGATSKIQHSILTSLIRNNVVVKMNSFSFDQNMILVDDLNADYAFTLIYNELKKTNVYKDTDENSDQGTHL